MNEKGIEISRYPFYIRLHILSSMRRFCNTKLWEVLKSSGDLPRTSKELDEYLDEFIVELHNYCRTEKNIAERTRSLDYARSELLVAELDIAESDSTKSILKTIRSVVYNGVGTPGALHFIFRWQRTIGSLEWDDCRVA